MLHDLYIFVMYIIICQHLFINAHCSSFLIPELRLVILGHTGAGVTSTVNNILQQQVFKERQVDASRSETLTCDGVSRRLGNCHLTVIDTPGFFNTERSQEHIEEEIEKCISMVSPGPHAFLLVISMIHWFFPHMQEIMRRIEAKFGRAVYK